jgi:hypothetical protein
LVVKASSNYLSDRITDLGHFSGTFDHLEEALAAAAFFP